MINEMSIKLGRHICQQKAGRYYETFEEGEEFKKLHEKLNEIRSQRAEIERLKKNKKSKLQKKDSMQMPPPSRSINEMSEFDLEESEYNNIDKTEQKEVYTFKLRLLDNEEKKIMEALSVLKKEKVNYVAELKRLREEDASKFCNPRIRDRPQIL